MRKLGVVLLGVGVFLLVLAPILRFYTYPKLAVAPKAQNSVTTLVGDGATVFDIASLKEIQTDLTTKVKTVGDVPASDKVGNNTVVWVSSSSTKSSDGVMRSRDVERVAFDATTAEAVNCCGEFVSDTEDENRPVRHRGLLVKFPFNTQKKTYDFWDGSLEKAVPIKYVGTASVQGLKVYKFAQTIPATKTGDTDVPAALVGASGSDTVTVDRMYSNERTLWVEPNTGVIINRQEVQDNTLDYNGESKITTTKVTTGYDAKTIKDNVDKYDSTASQLALLRTTVPLVALVLGLLLIIGGLVLGRSRR